MSENHYDTTFHIAHSEGPTQEMTASNAHAEGLEPLGMTRSCSPGNLPRA